MDVLKAVGPGGDFLGQRHTRRHLRRTSGAARILNRASYDRWSEDGATDATEKARQRARELLATHEVAPLPDGSGRAARRGGAGRLRRRPARRQLAGTVRPAAHSRKKAIFSRAVEAIGGIWRSSASSSSSVSGVPAEKAV